MDCVMQLVHISFEEKTKRKWPWTCVYPQKDKLRNPKIDYTAIGFHNGRMDTETFQHIDISKVKSIHELAIYKGLKSMSKLSSFSAVPDYFFFQIFHSRFQRSQNLIMGFPPKTWRHPWIDRCVEFTGEIRTKSTSKR